MKKINNELIRSFYPCYDPSEKNIPEDETLSVLEWVNKYRGIVPDKDIIWLLCRPEFMSDKKLRLFAVWCAREALKLVNNPDERSINACDIAEKFALGEATAEDLAAARAAAWSAAVDAIETVVDATRTTAERAVRAAAEAAGSAAYPAAPAGIAAGPAAAAAAAPATSDAGPATPSADARWSLADGFPAWRWSGPPAESPWRDR